MSEDEFTSAQQKKQMKQSQVLKTEQDGHGQKKHESPIEVLPYDPFSHTESFRANPYTVQKPNEE